MSKKETILNVAEQYFAEHGYTLSRLDHIAKECDITKPAIYYHFKNKASLYEEVLLKSFSQLSKYIEIDTNGDNPIENLEKYITILGDYFIKHPYFASIFSREIAKNGDTLPKSSIKELSKILNRLHAILLDGKKRDIFSCENPFMMQVMIVGTLTSYMTTDKLRKKVYTELYDKEETLNPKIENISKKLSEKIIKALLC